MILPALWAFLLVIGVSRSSVRRDRSKHEASLTTTMLKVPFDVDRWREVAEEAGPLPEPWSDDPTQWLFEGDRRCRRRRCRSLSAGSSAIAGPSSRSPTISTRSPMPTGSCVCRRSRVSRPQRIGCSSCLQRRSASAWSPAKVKELLEQAGSKKKNLADWLRDEFFKQHCALFGNRPFVWHIWDGQRDGFSALVNYHRLDRKTLEKLTYTYLGQDWVERQRAEVRDGVAGAEARLAAALGLQKKLEAILEGEAPLDIYVRWKETARAAHRVGARPERRRPPQHPPVRGGGRAAVAVQHPLAQGPRQEPRRHRAAQRRPPHAGREARSTEEGRPGVSETVLDRVVGCLRAALDAFDPNVRVAPVALLWTDEGAQWAPIVPRIAERLPVVSLGAYEPEARRGPAYWLRCVVARTIDAGLPAGPIVVYLPGVSRSELRAADTCPPELAPIAELQYRSQWFSHPNNRDWTVRALLTNRERGLGLRIADDPDTSKALLLALDRLLDEPVDRLAKQVLDADLLLELVNEDLVGSLLRWLDDPHGFQTHADSTRVDRVRPAVQVGLRASTRVPTARSPPPGSSAPGRASGRTCGGGSRRCHDRYPGHR